MLHFAYGSNMGRAPMRRRCPGAQAIGIGLIRGHRFVIMANGYASVLPTAGEQVHGVLWRITARDSAALNAYENVEGGLYRHAMMPVAWDAGTVRALVYVGCEAREGRPRPGYMDGVIAAAHEWNLPADYVGRLKHRSPGGWRGSLAPETGELR